MGATTANTFGIDGMVRSIRIGATGSSDGAATTGSVKSGNWLYQLDFNTGTYGALQPPITQACSILVLLTMVVSTTAFPTFSQEHG